MKTVTSEYERRPSSNPGYILTLLSLTLAPTIRLKTRRAVGPEFK